MAWKPWSQFNADINTEIARSSAGSDGPQDTPSGDAASGSGNATGVLVQTESGEPNGECPSSYPRLSRIPGGSSKTARTTEHLHKASPAENSRWTVLLMLPQFILGACFDYCHVGWHGALGLAPGVKHLTHAAGATPRPPRTLMRAGACPGTRRHAPASWDFAPVAWLPAIRRAATSCVGQPPPVGAMASVRLNLHLQCPLCKKAFHQSCGEGEWTVETKESLSHRLHQHMMSVHDEDVTWSARTWEQAKAIAFTCWSEDWKQQFQVPPTAEGPPAPGPPQPPPGPPPASLLRAGGAIAGAPAQSEASSSAGPAVPPAGHRRRSRTPFPKCRPPLPSRMATQVGSPPRSPLRQPPPPARRADIVAALERVQACVTGIDARLVTLTERLDRQAAALSERLDRLAAALSTRAAAKEEGGGGSWGPWRGSW